MEKNQGVRGQRIPRKRRHIDDQQSTFLNFGPHSTLLGPSKQGLFSNGLLVSLAAATAKGYTISSDRALARRGSLNTWARGCLRRKPCISHTRTRKETQTASRVVNTKQTRVKKTSEGFAAFAHDRVVIPLKNGARYRREQIHPRPACTDVPVITHDRRAAIV
jgi:hypothetical protein